MPPRNPAPERVHIRSHVSPKIADTLFYELHKFVLPRNVTPDDYGQAHPNTSEFPNHQLAFIEPADEEEWQKWWYIADRTTQETYNYSITYPYGGNEDYPRYSRVLVTARDAYVAVTPGTADPVFTGAILVSQKVDRFDDPKLDSLYVMETRIYDDVPDVSSSAGQADLMEFGYEISYPYDTRDFERLTWRVPVANSTYLGTDPPVLPDNDDCPFATFTDLQLITQSFKAAEDQNQFGVITRVYEKLAGPELLSTKLAAPTREIPGKFIRDVTSVLTKQKLADTNTLDPAWDGSGEMESQSITFKPYLGAMDDDTGTPNTEENYVAVDWDSSSELVSENSKITLMRRFLNITGTPRPLRSFVTDPDTGEKIEVIEELVPQNFIDGVRTNTELYANAGYVAAGGGGKPDSDGFTSEVRAINDSWAIKTTRKVSGLVDSRQYTTHISGVYWPPVLVPQNSSDLSTGGGGPDYFNLNVSGEGFAAQWELESSHSGPTRALIQEQWVSAVPNGRPYSADIMRPTRIHWSGNLLKLSVPSCLHDDIVIWDTFDVFEWDASQIWGGGAGTDLSGVTPGYSDLTDWPDAFLLRETVRPWKGGFLLTATQVFKPLDGGTA